MNKYNFLPSAVGRDFIRGFCDKFWLWGHDLPTMHVNWQSQTELHSLNCSFNSKQQV